MGRPKLLLALDGRTLLSRALATTAAVADTTLVVVGAHADAYRAEAEAGGARVVVNPDWREGMGSSVRCGVAALPLGVERALLVLPDQPFVAADHLRALFDAQAAIGAPLAFSRYPDGNLGVPALIHRVRFDAVARLPGHCGARALLRAGETAAEVALDASAQIDIDTPEEAARYLDARPEP